MSLPKPEPNLVPPQQPSVGEVSPAVPAVDATGGSPTVSQLAAIAAWREEVRAAGERYRSARARRFGLRALFVLITLACVASAALGFLVQWAARALGQLHSARKTLDTIQAEAVEALRQSVPTRQPAAGPPGVRVYSDPQGARPQIDRPKMEDD